MHTYTWTKLANNSAILNPKTHGRNYPAVKKFELELVLPYVGTKSVLVKLKAWGITEHNIHNVTLLFNDCEIFEGEHPELSLWKYFKIEYKNKIYYVKKFNRNRNPLTSRCSCSSYFYEFAYYNFKNGNCLYGPPPRPYKRKTKTRPRKNPRGIPGICKHLFWAWDFLTLRGLALK